ncbi:hypothetical protein ACFYXC_05960 [Streptomyces sp. NPDC002701]|uniref:hypothetical protein n=1 Tax=unclassified Streptomyces TaxID=2593676 RepID=UPI0036D044A0
MPLSRTARALSATALTTVALGTAAAAATANSEAEVSPRSVAPGGTVTVSVRCAPSGGPPPAAVDATSRAFEHGTARLHRAGAGENPPGEEDPADGDTPEGLEDAEGMNDAEDAAGGEDPAGMEDTAGMRDPSGDEDSVSDEELADDEGPAAVDDPKGDEGPEGGITYSGTARIAPAADFEEGGAHGGGRTSEWSADGVCPAAPGGEGKAWRASFTVSPEGSHGDEEARHGVRAGAGGAFNDSTIALVSGGVLITGALGAAVHRLRHRESSQDG